MENNNLKLEVQRYCFAAHDMQLFLDTHPDDKKAFALFVSLTKKAQELKKEYVEKYGPLAVTDAAAYDSYKWLDEPWPWEKGGNA